MIDIPERQKQRIQLLDALYEAVGGAPNGGLRDTAQFAAGVGLTRQQAHEILMYLANEGLLKFGGGITDGGWIEITHRGVVEVERARQRTDPEESEPQFRDAVTQLLNRAAFDAAILDFTAEALREKNPLGLVFGDIDRFKAINDTHGHQAGDAVLREVARTLERAAQWKGRVFRYGGEEFCLILRNHSRNEALAVAERARREIEARPLNGLTVSMSFGVACLPDDAADVDSLVLAADKAMYDAKNRGRNLVRGFGEPAPTIPAPREPERKLPVHGQLTEVQRTELRSQYLQGTQIRCPEDHALLRVVDVTTMDSGPPRRKFSVNCPNCGMRDQI